MGDTNNWWDAFGEGQDAYGNPWSGVTGNSGGIDFVDDLASQTPESNLGGIQFPAAAAQTPTWLQKLMGGSQPGQNLGDLSKVLGGFSSGEKANRMVQGNFTQNYDRNMLQAQTDRNLNEADALKKLHQTAYTLDGGSHFKMPTSMSIGGTQHAVPDLGLAPRAPSDMEKAGAGALQGQLINRLSPGGSYQPQPLSDYAKPGISEQIGNFGSLGAGGLGTVATMFGGGGAPTGGGSGALGDVSKIAGTVGAGAGLASKMGIIGGGASNAASGASGAASGIGSILSKAVPIAGAATGLIGLAQNHGTGSNIMNGVGSGASIGSMFGGPIGAGIGAGVGALAGYFRGKGGPSQTELQGRGAEGSFEKSFGGFQPMMNAIGQGYQSTGHSAAEAQADAKAMLDAEKNGGAQTGAIIQQILSKMGKTPGNQYGVPPSPGSAVPNQAPNFKF